MISLDLKTTPQQRNLQQNAAPHIRAILAASNELATAAKEFRGSNDNRELIQKAITKLVEQGSALEDVTSEDLRLKAAQQQIDVRRVALQRTLANIQQGVPYLVSAEEGVSTRRKLVGAKLAQLSADLSSSKLDPAFCETAAQSADQVNSWIAEILTLDTRLDPWAPNRMQTACTGLAALLRTPVPAAEEPTSEPRRQNSIVVALLPAIDEVRERIGGLGRSEHGGWKRVEPIYLRVRELQRELQSKTSEPVDFSELRGRVVRIQADLRGLDYLPSRLGSEVSFAFFQQESRSAHRSLANLLKAIPTE